MLIRRRGGKFGLEKIPAGLPDRFGPARPRRTGLFSTAETEAGRPGEFPGLRVGAFAGDRDQNRQIGRASCRERVLSVV